MLLEPDTDQIYREAKQKQNIPVDFDEGRRTFMKGLLYGALALGVGSGIAGCLGGGSSPGSTPSEKVTGNTIKPMPTAKPEQKVCYDGFPWYAENLDGKPLPFPDLPGYGGILNRYILKDGTELKLEKPNQPWYLGLTKDKMDEVEKIVTEFIGFDVHSWTQPALEPVGMVEIEMEKVKDSGIKVEYEGKNEEFSAAAYFWFTKEGEIKSWMSFLKWARPMNFADNVADYEGDGFIDMTDAHAAADKVYPIIKKAYEQYFC